MRQKNNDLINSLLQEEQKKIVNRSQSSSLSRLGHMSNAPTDQIYSLPIDNLYPAPYNSEWNSYSPLNAEAQYELNKTIIDKGLINPIVVLEMPREALKAHYIDDHNPYTFVGDRYMVLSGHSRVKAYYQLQRELGEYYSNINAIVKRGLTIEESKYIIKVSNYCTRQLSEEEKRKSILFMYNTLSNQSTRGSKVAEKIAKDTGDSLRTVQYKLSISKNLIDDFIDMYDRGVITLRNAVKLCKLNKNLQSYIISNYSGQITNKIISKLPPSCDRQELIDSVFKLSSDIDIVTVSFKVNRTLETRLRSMVKYWIKKETENILRN